MYNVHMSKVKSPIGGLVDKESSRDLFIIFFKGKWLILTVKEKK